VRLEGLALDAMVKLGDLELQAGSCEQALAAANRAISINNLREDAHRLAIRALAAAGRRADALKRKRRRGRDARVLTDTGRPPHGNWNAVWLTDVGWEEVRGARRSALYSVPVGR
jgi:hypothetical protein